LRILGIYLCSQSNLQPNYCAIMRRKFLLALSLLTSFCLFATNDEGEQVGRASTTSSYSLINPPNSSITWTFAGNQVIWVKVENGNVLGVAVDLTCNNHSPSHQNYKKNLILLPKGSTEDMRYNTFGYTPIGWSFSLSTIADAALVYGQAHWDAF